MNPMKKITAIHASFLVLAIILFALLLQSSRGLAQYSSAADRNVLTAQKQVDDTHTLIGYLNAAWGDGEDWTRQGPFYSLVLDDGQTISLEVEGEALKTIRQLRLAQGQRVQVGGGWAEGVARGGLDHFIAMSIEPAGGLRAVDVSGSQPWLTIMCKFADYPTETRPLSYFQAQYSNTYPFLDHYWREVSYNNIDLVGSMSVGWYTLPHPRSTYIGDFNGDGVVEAKLSQLMNDCTAAADPDVYFPSFIGINTVYNANLDCCAWGGGRTMTLDGVTKFYSTTWLPPWAFQDLSIIKHEMGHGFGLDHSSGMYGYVYDNYWDVMSRPGGACNYAQSGYGCAGQHTIAAYKDFLDWIVPGQHIEISTPGTFTITLERLAQPITNNTLLVRIPSQFDNSIVYSVEARKQVGYDGQLPGQGVIIHQLVDDYAYVVDIDGNGNTGDAGAIWLPGESYVDYTHGITITVLSSTGTGYVVRVTNAASPLPTPTPTPTSTSAPTATPVTGDVVVENIWTADGSNTPKSTFFPDDTIHYFARVNNTTGVTQTVYMTWDVTGPCGTIAFWNGDLEQDPGITNWYLQSTIPLNACAGTYTFAHTFSDRKSGG